MASVALHSIRPSIPYRNIKFLLCATPHGSLAPVLKGKDIGSRAGLCAKPVVIAEIIDKGTATFAATKAIYFKDPRIVFKTLVVPRYAVFNL
jgi:hypothetical protein